MLIRKDLVSEVFICVFQINGFFFDIYQGQLIVTPATQTGLQGYDIFIAHLLQGNASDLKWKILPDQKKVLDYVCQKAILQDTSRHME